MFRKAESQGVKITALDDYPQLSAEELSYYDAFVVLSGAGYADISKYCDDHDLTMDEREDLSAMMTALSSHLSRRAKDAHN